MEQGVKKGQCLPPRGFDGQYTGSVGRVGARNGTRIKVDQKLGRGSTPPIHQVPSLFFHNTEQFRVVCQAHGLVSLPRNKLDRQVD